MNILQVNPFYHPYSGGIENVLLELNKRLARDNEVSVLTSRLGGTPKYEEIDGVKVYRMPSFVFYKLPSLLPPPFSIPVNFSSSFIRACRKEKPDITHLHNRFFPPFHPMILWKRLLHKPMFLTIHNTRPRGINPQTDLFGGLYDDTLGAIVMRSADYITGVSRHALDSTCPDIPKERKRVIYNGIDTKAYRKVKTSIKDEIGCEHLIMTSSRHQPQKGLDYFIKALPLVKGDYHVLIGSGGPERKNLEALASALNVTDRVTFTGRVPDQYMREMYSASDIYVLPSVYEPFGIVLLEAMCTDTAVIATSVGGIPEVVGDAGILVPPRDPENLASAIEELFDNRKRQDYIKRGKERAKLFDWDVIAKQYEQAYREFLEARK